MNKQVENDVITRDEKLGGYIAYDREWIFYAKNSSGGYDEKLLRAKSGSSIDIEFDARSHDRIVEVLMTYAGMRVLHNKDGSKNDNLVVDVDDLNTRGIRTYSWGGLKKHEMKLFGIFILESDGIWHPVTGRYDVKKEFSISSDDAEFDMLGTGDPPPGVIIPP